MTDEDISEVWEAIRRIEAIVSRISGRLDRVEGAIAMQYGAMGTLSDSEPSIITSAEPNAPGLDAMPPRREA